MRRKLVRLGGNTLMVSLPAKWAKMHSLSKGDEVYVEQDGETLSVSPISGSRLKEISVSYGSEQPARRVFYMPYIRGYDRISISFTNSSVISFVEKHLFALTGFEILTQKPNSITLQSIISDNPESFSSVFERLYNVIISMLHDLAESFRNGNFEGLQSIAKSESLANKLDFYCRRILHKGMYPNKEMQLSMYNIVRGLESITDMIAMHINSAPQKEFRKESLMADAMESAISLLRINHKILAEAGTTHLDEVRQEERHFQALMKRAKFPHNSLLYSLYHTLHHINEEAVHYK